MRRRTDRLLGRHRLLRQRRPLQLAQPAREPGVQLWRGRAAAAPATAASATAAARPGDADVPGWLGDPGDEHLPAAATSAPAAAAGPARRTREIVRVLNSKGEQRSRAR